MPIKKSFLEQKWYYRIAKVLYWAPPLLIIIFILLIDGKDFYNALQNKGDIFAISTIYVVMAAIAYLVIVAIVWRIFLYIVFGGLENDTTKKSTETIKSTSGTTSKGSLSDEDKKQIGFYISLLILLGLFYWIYTYKTTPNPSPTPNKNTTCVPTGCGSSWYCSGSYYSDGQQIRVNGCVSKRPGETNSSWTGTCRKCP